MEDKRWANCWLRNARQAVLVVRDFLGWVPLTLYKTWCYRTKEVCYGCEGAKPIVHTNSLLRVIFLLIKVIAVSSLPQEAFSICITGWMFLRKAWHSVVII